MKVIPLSEEYEIAKIENNGERIQIRSNKEGIQEKDFIYLTKHPDLRHTQFEVIKVWQLDGILHASLAKVPLEEK